MQCVGVFANGDPYVMGDKRGALPVTIIGMTPNSTYDRQQYIVDTMSSRRAPFRLTWGSQTTGTITPVTNNVPATAAAIESALNDLAGASVKVVPVFNAWYQFAVVVSAGTQDPMRSSDAAHVVNYRVRHGAMIDPVGLRESGTPITHGYDNSCASTRYDQRLNVGFNVSPTNPLVLRPAYPNGVISVVKSVSYDGLPVDSRSRYGRRPIRKAAVLTVLRWQPNAGTFRLSFAQRKAPSANASLDRFRERNINWSLLRELDPPANATIPAQSALLRMVERPWTDHSQYWMGESVAPAENFRNYGRDMGREVSLISLYLHTKLDADRSKSLDLKRELAIRFIQVGIDLYGVFRSPGGTKIWQGQGGYSAGRKWPILFAGLMLGDQEMLNVGQAFSVREPDLAKRAHFGEDGQTVLLTSQHMSEGRCFSEKGYKVGDATWGGAVWSEMLRSDKDDHNGLWVDTATWKAHNPSTDACATANGITRNNSYRWCCTARAWGGFVLAARIMRAKALWNHDALFDYVDLYMTRMAEANRRNPTDWPAGLRSDDPFIGQMWDRYRSQF